MKSIIQNLAEEDFPRIRIGIGRPKEDFDKINYVIGSINEEQHNILQKGVSKAADAVEDIIKNGVDKAMNKFN